MSKHLKQHLDLDEQFLWLETGLMDDFEALKKLE